MKRKKVKEIMKNLNTLYRKLKKKEWVVINKEGIATDFPLDCIEEAREMLMETWKVNEEVEITDEMKRDIEESVEDMVNKVKEDPQEDLKFYIMEMKAMKRYYKRVVERMREMNEKS